MLGRNRRVVVQFGGLVGFYERFMRFYNMFFSIGFRLFVRLGLQSKSDIVVDCD